MDPKALSLTWEAYGTDICSGLSLLQQKGEFVDMTLAAGGHHVKVHQMVMSLVSPYIKELIIAANCPHPVIVFNKVTYETLQSILEYAYTGEVTVAPENLTSFLEACKDLHIKGIKDLIMHRDAKELLHTGKGLDNVFEPTENLMVDSPINTEEWIEETTEAIPTIQETTEIKKELKRKKRPRKDEEILYDENYSLQNAIDSHYVEIEPYRAGSRWFCRDNHYFVVNRTKGPTMFLRCADDRCDVRWVLSTKKGPGPIVGTHNHEPAPWIPNRNAMFQSLKHRTTTESLPLYVIYQQEAVRYHNAVPHLPFESVVPSMRKWRKSAEAAARSLQPTG